MKVGNRYGLGCTCMALVVVEVTIIGDGADGSDGR